MSALFHDPIKLIAPAIVVVFLCHLIVQFVRRYGLPAAALERALQLNHLLSRKRGLAADMLNGIGDIAIDVFATYLTPAQSLDSLEGSHHAI